MLIESFSQNGYESEHEQPCSNLFFTITDAFDKVDSTCLPAVREMEATATQPQAGFATY